MNTDFDLFLQKFSEAVEDDNILICNEDSNFREFESWDSFSLLAIIAMIDVEYKVNITAMELHQADTLGKLYSLVMNKV
jgi:acyl carrier protein